MLIACLINVAFLALNILTLEWHPLPWVDEVAYSDYSINFVLDGEWRTSAWGGDKNNQVYSVYPPLYQFILTPWVKLFGISLLSCRSLNVVLVFFSCLVFCSILRRANIIKNLYSLILFLFLFWGAGVFSWIYRNGRPDVVGMLCVIGFFVSYYYFLHNKIAKWILSIFSFLIITAGIQSSLYVICILLCLLFFQSDRKSVKNAIYMFIIGLAGGLFFLSVYFYSQGFLLQFYYRTFLFSSSLKDFVSFLISHIEHWISPINTDIKEALLKTSHSPAPPFLERICDAYLANKEYLVLCAANGLLSAYLLLSKRISSFSIEIKLLIISLVVPIFMTFAGRFVSYYTWMSYLPAVICLVYIAGKHSKLKCISIGCSLVAIAIVCSGLFYTLTKANKRAYKNVEAFIAKQNFTNQDKIISPFISYYFVRNITKECYFVGVYPLSLVPEDTKYILNAEEDYGAKNVDIYIEQCKSNNKKVLTLDSLDTPHIILYFVNDEQRHSSPL
jgi:4-amino-4-deoxy-L-arabinose transferase-like glycosyltransferase